MTEGRFVAYYRVSTDRQGRSGLGLEAQREAVRGYVAQRAGTVLDEFTEVETGKRSDRPELAAALETCRRHKATLVIAKLDRLARNMAFVANLMEGRADFVAADMPHADKFTIHIFAALAEEEGRRISQRTKAALAAAKARGVRLGATGALLAERYRAGAKAQAAELAPLVIELRRSGVTTVRGLAAALNARAIPTAGGGPWRAGTVHRLLQRVLAFSEYAEASRTASETNNHSTNAE